MSKPHLILNWTFDIPNNILFCDIDENLKYVAHEGGTKGFSKFYRTNSDEEFVETHMDVVKWDKVEKYWISHKYGDKLGYYQLDYDRVLQHPDEDRPDPSPYGVGPDGRYLDHMQRMQVLLEGHDCARIGTGKSNVMFVTPDKGKTIYKRIPTRDVLYANIQTDETSWYPEHPQPCMMQPRSPGVRLSSYEEMLSEGIEEDTVDTCKQHKWASPKHPELQKWYIYPTE
jgi:hypothetical protein